MCLLGSACILKRAGPFPPAAPGRQAIGGVKGRRTCLSSELRPATVASTELQRGSNCRLKRQGNPPAAPRRASTRTSDDEHRSKGEDGDWPAMSGILRLFKARWVKVLYQRPVTAHRTREERGT